ncbi:acyltransferase family protein [Parahaliea mediterranea]|uniref:Acyltransferase n=1 Tax=Parahaliea mediterranea TaxID=651086 RepID=A0A939DBH1_9GAMM|nr:acyltransferase [Parahaliea mediterranea]
MNASRGQIQDIQILRAVAVLAVIFQHLRGNLLPKNAFEGAWWHLFGGGWVGVDLFFAISGFVIARSLLPRFDAVHGAGDFRRVALGFWTARLFRLAPSAWLWLFIILLLCVFWNRSGVFGTLETNLWWTLSGVLNFSNYLFVQYFGVAKPGASFVYWSLSLEEQFYLVFPFLVWLFRRRLVWPLLLLVAVQLFSARGLYGMMFRTDAVALGVIIALAQDMSGGTLGVDRVPLALRRLLVVVSLAGLVAVGNIPQDQLPTRVGLVALLSGLCVWLCSGRDECLVSRRWLADAWLWIGARSYALYLVHVPSLFFTRELFYRLDVPLGEYKVVAIGIALALMFVAAALNYGLVEQPLRSRGTALARGIESGGRKSSETPLAEGN